MATRILDEDEYNKWDEQFQEAAALLDGRDDAIEKLITEARAPFCRTSQILHPPHPMSNDAKPCACAPLTFISKPCNRLLTLILPISVHHPCVQTMPQEESCKIAALRVLQVETDLELVGVTAIEDKLQDGVPAAIQTLLDAGMKVTGHLYFTEQMPAHARSAPTAVNLFWDWNGDLLVDPLGGDDVAMAPFVCWIAHKKHWCAPAAGVGDHGGQARDGDQHRDRLQAHPPPRLPAHLQRGLARGGVPAPGRARRAAGPDLRAHRRAQARHVRQRRASPCRPAPSLGLRTALGPANLVGKGPSFMRLF